MNEQAKRVVTLFLGGVLYLVPMVTLVLGVLTALGIHDCLLNDEQITALVLILCAFALLNTYDRIIRKQQIRDLESAVAGCYEQLLMLKKDMDESENKSENPSETPIETN